MKTTHTNKLTDTECWPNDDGPAELATISWLLANCPELVCVGWPENDWPVPAIHMHLVLQRVNVEAKILLLLKPKFRIMIINELSYYLFLWPLVAAVGIQVGKLYEAVRVILALGNTINVDKRNSFLPGPTSKELVNCLITTSEESLNIYLATCRFYKFVFFMPDDEGIPPEVWKSEKFRRSQQAWDFLGVDNYSHPIINLAVIRLHHVRSLIKCV